jgi:recombination protein RecA
MTKQLASKEDLYRDFYELGLSPDEVIKKYGYKDYNSLWAATKRRGVPYPHYKVGTLQLTDDQHQVVMGSLLGDGNLPKKCGHHSYLRIAHGHHQEEYIHWKADLMDKWVRPGGVHAEQRKDRPHPMFVFSTFTHPIFSHYRDLFYPEGKRIIPPVILQQLEPLGIAIMFMDNGSHMSKKRGVRLHSAGFTFAENEMMREWFETRWLIPCTVSKISGGYPVLNFYGDSATALSRIVAPHIVPSLRYKFDI